MKITLSARALWRLSASLVLSGLALALLSVLAQPAHAARHFAHWAAPVVCVDNHATTKWPVKEAARVVDAALPEPNRLVMGPCDAHDQVVTVLSEARGSSSYAGSSTYITVDPNRPNRISAVRIELKELYWLDWEPHYRLNMVVHELLHMWLDHSDAYSMMNYDVMFGVTGPTDRDVADIYGTYTPYKPVRPYWRYGLPA